MHTIAEEGEGEFGVAGEGKEEGGEGVEVRVVCMCICGSVSIVVGTSPPPSFKEWMGTAGPAAALSLHCVMYTQLPLY